MLKQGLIGTLTFRTRKWFLGLPLAAIKPLIVGHTSQQTVFLKVNGIKKALLHQAKERGLNDNTTGLRKGNITAIPTCFAQLLPSHLAKNSKVLPPLFLDSINSSALVNYNGKPIFWDSIQHGWDALSLLIKASFSNAEPTGNQTISLIQCATRLSHDVFFIEFYPSVGYQRSLIGYYDEQLHLKFIGLNMGKVVLFNNIDQYIGKVFGSKLKLKEFLEQTTVEISDVKIVQEKENENRELAKTILKMPKPVKLAVHA